jgi:hypothetical protein
MQLGKSVCTPVCTSKAENDNGTDLDALAAALLRLSPEDRTRLAALLTGTAPAPADGGA